MEYYIVDAFTDKPFGGNPAGVVLLDGEQFPKEELMQQVAAELRYSETAFVLRHSANNYTLRYFTPCHEVELCGHATIATFFVLYREGLAHGSCQCHTLAGNLNVVADRSVMMQMATPGIIDTIDHPEDIYHAVGLTGYNPTLPVQTVRSGLIDIMLPLPDVATLQALQPDMNAIAALTRQIGAVSIHPFATTHDGYTAHVRDFAPLYGVPEESATGTANAALTHYLQQHGIITPTGSFSFLQGEAIGRPSVVATQLAPDGSLHVGGTAAIVAHGQLLP